jgi:hypothetical protein
MALVRVPALLLVPLLCVSALLVAAPSAAAQGSDFDQYVPQVPEAGGEAPVRDKKEQSARDRDPAGGGDAVVPPEVAEELAAEGETGAAAASAAEATAPKKDKDKDKGKGGKAEAGDGQGGVSAAGAVAETAASDSDDGIGVALPLLLAATLAAAITYLIAVRRRRDG